MTPEQLLGRYLRELRLSRGWTLVELADKTGMANGSLSRIERGQCGTSIKVICKLARSFNISPCEILMKSGYLDEFKY